MGYIRKEDVIRRCEAAKHLAEIRINEWRGHTAEYKEQVSCQEAFNREREMRDMIMFLNDLPDEDVRENSHGYWIFDDADEYGNTFQCSCCKTKIVIRYRIPDFDYCPYCGAEMNE